MPGHPGSVDTFTGRKPARNTASVGCGDMDVVLLRWPQEQDRRESLAAAGVARLLLLDESTSVPDIGDCLEDWVRVPVNEDEVRARARGLACRGAAHRLDTPSIDADGVVRSGSRWTHVPPVEARVLALLIDRFDAVVTRDVLMAAAWPGRSIGRNVLDVHVLRLRRRLLPLGLAIRTVRARGYLLERA